MGSMGACLDSAEGTCYNGRKKGADGMVREAQREDLQELLQLYLYLHETAVPEQSEQLHAVWAHILSDPMHHVLVYEEEGRLVSTCVCLIVPNLTRSLRPYALIENVVTHPDCRGRGFASACLAYARELARQAGCYKLMLMTGSRQEATLDFYRRAGFNSTDKTGFVQWL